MSLRPFRHHLARKAEQTPDPSIAEAFRLLVKRWDEEGEPVLAEDDGSIGRTA
ncbi:MAG: hypothetical protein LH654_14125 [Thermoleophilia bacterium]|nr:hypothetical protein [Thermoleophilia bacterium]